MQTDNQCAASLIRCLAEVLRCGDCAADPKCHYCGEFSGPTYDFKVLSVQLDKAHVYGNGSGGARHFTLAALEQAADRLEETI